MYSLSSSWYMICRKMNTCHILASVIPHEQISCCIFDQILNILKKGGGGDSFDSSGCVHTNNHMAVIYIVKLKDSYFICCISIIHVPIFVQPRVNGAFNFRDCPYKQSIIMSTVSMCHLFVY